MKVFRPGLSPVFTDEDTKDQPVLAKAPPKGPVKPGESPFLTPSAALAAARARALAAGQKPHDEKAPLTGPTPNPTAHTQQTTEIIPPVAPQPLIDNNVHIPSHEERIAKLKAELAAEEATNPAQTPKDELLL
jgi:hypothetical protein